MTHSTDLLHEVLMKQLSLAPHINLPPRESDLVSVQTAPSSQATSPASSRESSARGKSRSGKGRPRRDKAAERLRAAQRAAAMDPLTKLPTHINVRIFSYLSWSDLLQCSTAVCKHWRKSATLNYVWYLDVQLMKPPSERDIAAVTKDASEDDLRWSLANSQTRWLDAFKELYLSDKAEDDGSDHDENGLTLREERELRWKEENEAGVLSKEEQREYYKSLANKKVRNKTGKGAEQTWV